MERESLRMNQQRGSTLVGFIIGLVVGLGIALAVAIYVTKVPIPFMSKGPVRSADSDAVEAEKNKDWDPNAPLYGKKGAKSGDKPMSQKRMPNTTWPSRWIPRAQTPWAIWPK